MTIITSILSPQGTLSVATILIISFILGLLHGATPDEHTWPITFSYAIGSFSTRKGMKSGFAFSAGFTAQRALLTTLGFLGLAGLYIKYNLDGPVYVIVGIAMVVAGAYILRKRIYKHIPIDVLLGGHGHHTGHAERLAPEKAHSGDGSVPLKAAVVHGLIAGFGFGAYAAIITFILAPKVPSIWYAPLPGLMFGIGTMVMQIIFGAVFANLTRIKKLTKSQAEQIGRGTAGNTLYYGGIFFAIIGILIILFPAIDKIAISTGSSIPNLDSFGISTLLVLVVVGTIGLGNLVLGFRRMSRLALKSRG